MNNFDTLASGLKKIGSSGQFKLILWSMLIDGGVCKSAKKRLETMLLDMVQAGTITLFEMKEVYNWSAEIKRTQEDINKLLAAAKRKKDSEA